MSGGITRVLRADAGALDAVANYRAARQRGEWCRLLLAGADLRDTDMSGLSRVPIGRARRRELEPATYLWYLSTFNGTMHPWR